MFTIVFLDGIYMSIKLVVFGMVDTNVKDGYEAGLTFKKAMPDFRYEHIRIGNVTRGLNNVSRY